MAPIPGFKLLSTGSRWEQTPHPQAAVLLLICLDTPEPYTLLTRRSPGLTHHAGQISLPGGKRTATDPDPEMTALREAAEETGVTLQHIDLLGRLPRVTVSSGFEITPVVATSAVTHTLVAQPGEVEEIITCPLDLVLHGHYRRESLTRDGIVRDFLVLDHNGHRIWGATARILYSLAQASRAASGLRVAPAP
jgi:8-oxo-dGTP pyrophosphatase MutT (NUDIX family)